MMDALVERKHEKREAEVRREVSHWFRARQPRPCIVRGSRSEQCGFGCVLQAKEAAAEAKEAKREAELDAMEAVGRKSNRARGVDSPEPLRYDADLGMPIYSVDALKIGRGGGTALCPFDCECCF